MGPAAVPLVVLAAALLHAVWNTLAHGAADKMAGLALMNSAILGGGLVLVLFAPLPGLAAVPYLACSATLQIAYQFLLFRAYRLGDFGQVYPIARGSAPLLVAVLSVTVLGQALPLGRTAGILVISLGLAGLALAGGLPGRAELPALAAALGTGTTIACYTVVDGSGVRAAASTAGYIAWMFTVQGVTVLLVAFAVRGRPLLAAMRAGRVSGLAGGLMSLTAYGLVVWAQRYGDLATIAALRETSIVIGALIGALILREGLGRMRLAASATVLAGIAVLELAHG